MYCSASQECCLIWKKVLLHHSFCLAAEKDQRLPLSSQIECSGTLKISSSERKCSCVLVLDMRRFPSDLETQTNTVQHFTELNDLCYSNIVHLQVLSVLILILLNSTPRCISQIISRYLNRPNMKGQSTEKQSTNPLAEMFKVPTPDFNSVLPHEF